MQQIVYFIQKYKYFLLFLLLEVLALTFTIQSHSFHKSKFINSANAITGEFFKQSHSFFEYTSLKKENLKLAKENTVLRNALDLKNKEIFSYKIDTTFHKNIYFTAKVINNNYTKKNNTLTINKGRNHGLTIDMGVISSNGIVGIINNVSANYATVLSVLNGYSKINVRLKNSPFLGTLTWDGKDYKITQLHDIERQAPMQIGDSIISSGKSTLFPEGIIVGTIKEFDFKDKKYQNVQIQLSNDMSSLGHVYIIKNKHKKEIKQIENNND